MRLLKIKSALLSLLLAFVAPAANAGNVIVESASDSIMIWIGEQTGIHIGVTCDTGQDIVFPMFTDTIVRGLEIVGRPSTDTTFIDRRKRMTVTRSWNVTSFDENQYYLPPFQVQVDGETYSAQKGISLGVFMFDVDTLHTDQFFGPKENLPMKLTWKDVRMPLLWILLSFVMATVCLWLFIGWRDNKPIIRTIKVEPRKPAHEVALAEMERIRQEQLAHGEDAKLYYTSLTDAVRVYLNERFGFNATEMTSDEIVEALLEHKDKDSISELKSLLETADLVKFAKFKPMLGENDRNLVTAMEFVKETMVEVEPDAQAPKEEKVVIEQKRSKGARTAILVSAIIAAMASVFFLFEFIRKIYYLFF